MRHARRTLARRRPLFVEDPETGKRYPIPQGGDEDDDTPDDGDDDGGQDDDTGDGDDGQDADDQDDSDDEDKPLGPKGEKALRALKDKNRDLKRQLREARAANDKPKDQDGDDDLTPEQLRAQIRDEVKAETDAAVARDRALDKLEAKAARKFQNPDLARKLLADRADDFLDEQGKPDVEAITEALDELLEDEPYLAVTSATPSASGDAGSRRPPKDTDPAEMTDPDDVIKWGSTNRRRRF